MEIRKARIEELDTIMSIFARARSFMAETGNPNQWGSNKPERETIVSRCGWTTRNTKPF